MARIPLPQTAQYERNSKRCHGDDWPCIICGHPIKDNTSASQLRIIEGGYVVATADELAEESGDMGYFPIGADCLRRHPELRPFAFV